MAMSAPAPTLSPTVAPSQSAVAFAELEVAMASLACTRTTSSDYVDLVQMRDRLGDLLALNVSIAHTS